MPKYYIEFRVLEYHNYEVEASNADEAIDMVYDLDLEPMSVDPACYEVDSIEEINPAEQAQELLSEIKEELNELKEEMLSDSDYYALRAENADWLSGKANIGTEK
jgi:flagellin-specific chaperone FliS